MGFLYAEFTSGKEGGCLNGLAFQRGVNQLLLVDSLDERAAHLGLVEGSLLGVEHQEGVAVAGLGLDVPASALKLILCGGGHSLHHVDRATDGGGQTRRVILEGLPLEGGDGRGLVAVVVLVGNSGDLGRRDVLVLVGAGADRLGLERSSSIEEGTTRTLTRRSFRAAKGCLRVIVTVLSSFALTESTKVKN